MLPSGASVIKLDVQPFWGVTGTTQIDLRWMSTADGRRDLEKGKSGMFMALSEPKVVPAELKLPQGQLEHPGFLVQFQATLVVADYRKAGDARWSGKYYGPEYDFSRRVFSEAQPELEKSGCMGFVRKSAAMMNHGCSCRFATGDTPA